MNALLDKENRKMLASKWLSILLATACLALAAAPARAQQVLVCYTLHNDLANFDRRAHSVDHYLLPALARYGNVKAAYDSSHLGGQDVVRLRIIYEMRRFGCPISPEDNAWLDEYYRTRHGRSSHYHRESIGKVLSIPVK